MKIEGKVALVTGGAQGIGKAICEALLERGGKVSILDINKQTGLEQTRCFEKNYGRQRATFIACDVTSKPQLEAAFQRTKDIFGRLDIVCNNAGIVHMEDMSDGIWDKMIDINVKGVVLGTILGIQHMGTSTGKGHGGTIINVASMAGLLATADQPVYAATKHAVVGFSRSLEGLKEREGIRVNCICPTFTNTPMIMAELDNPKHAGKSPVVAVKRLGLLRPELVASGVVQLIEDESKNAAVMRVTKQKGIDYKKYFKPRL